MKLKNKNNQKNCFILAHIGQDTCRYKYRPIAVISQYWASSISQALIFSSLSLAMELMWIGILGWKYDAVQAVILNMFGI